ncbi:hypothetical protein B2K_07735 [Paenibacillus mucilaginosus K02]|uniref:Fibronectin type-III domain-containing protein n=1 Tax=Paenibacillus mucilaginosus K02 TaxID=997761 RepID=I0BE16_9BACL|nr:GDSL-type esterase/lipase family protein [Paenibacillus mucilaginosus]AFH60613.1 hypothetical protein B2K_07735 [Paenibacillus mucilaginosus K02]
MSRFKPWPGTTGSPGGGTGTGSLPRSYEGIEVVWWGNSIIEGQGLTDLQKFQTQLAKLNGMVNRIYGYPGKPWGYKGTGPDDTIYSNRALLPKTAKLYAMYGGGNDNRLNIPRGNVDDMVNTTFAGAINLGIVYIKTNMPGAKIVLITSLQRNGGDDGTGKPITGTTLNDLKLSLIDYNNMILAIGQKHDIPVWDLYNCGINNASIPKYMQSDGVHLNAQGAAKVALCGYGFFETIDLSIASSPADTTAPTVPGKPTMTSKAHNSVTIAWAASTDVVGVTGYIVTGGPSPVNVTGTSATIPGLNPETNYTFAVKAKDAAGNVSAASEALTVTTDAAPTGGGGTTVTTYYENTFTGADGSANGQVAESGQATNTATAVTPDNWVISGNRMKYSGTTGDRIIMSTSATGGDYTTEAQIYPAGGKASVVFRAKDGTEYMWVRFDQAGNAGEEIKMFKKHESTGANTQIAAGPAKINTTGSNIVKIVCAANNVKVFVDGNQAINYTLTAAEQAKYGDNTGVGLYAGGENASTWEYLKSYSN